MKEKEHKKEITYERVQKEYQKGVEYKTQINLYDTVEANENFFIGKQWEGVDAKGMPTPVFNFLKRIVLYLVACVVSDRIKMQASPLSTPGGDMTQSVDTLMAAVNAKFEKLFERNKMGKQLREFVRNCAVDGDCCFYSYFDTEKKTGQVATGEICVEIVDNTRVFFGNPTQRNVDVQPYIIISKREMVKEVQRRARENGQDPQAILPDSAEERDTVTNLAEGMVTVLTRFAMVEGTVEAIECTKNALVRPQWDTGLTRYPVAWMCWDEVKNSYHGQAAVTGLIPNQIFVNKAFAMTMISLMTTAYPKIIYDKTAVAQWDATIGRAVGVKATNGSIGDVAKVMGGATISPQIAQFIEMSISLTKEFMGATDAALGSANPDNTSAIVALQKASSVPLELVKQNINQLVEDVGNVWIDMMRAYYGVRNVDIAMTIQQRAKVQSATGTELPEGAVSLSVDFGQLEDFPTSVAIDVGGSAYWSELAQLTTLDNLMARGQIDLVEYLERLPSGYIAKQQDLLEAKRAQAEMAAQQTTQSTQMSATTQPQVVTL